jgi:hypothetical protein
MKLVHCFSISVAVLALALAVAPPAMAKAEGHGQHRGGGHSSFRGSGNGGSHSGSSRWTDRAAQRWSSRGDRSRSEGSRGRERAWSDNGGSSRGDRTWSRGGSRTEHRQFSGERRPASDSRIGTRAYRGETRVRRQPDARSERRWRDGGRVRETRTYSRSYGGYQRPSYSSRVRYRHDGPGYRSSYGSHGSWPRSYYTTYFPRPRYVYRSGFSLGFVIGAMPSYGYRYWDPYCGIGFRSLGSYSNHCHGHRHAELILIYQGSDPVASCVYRGGDWVVDDCYDRGYDDGYEDGYDDGYDDGGY